METPLCYRLSPSGLSLFIRVTPNAGRDSIEGAEARDDGTAVLRVRVSAVPDRGKANAAVILLVAKALGVPKSAVTVASGETSRLKTLAVAGDGKAIAAVLETLVVPSSTVRHPRA